MAFSEFQPGDILESKYGGKRLVRTTLMKTRTLPSRCRCGGCIPDTEEILVVCVDADEPVEVILKGGGTAKVLPVEEIEWPEHGAKVYRYGQLLHEEPDANV